MPKRLGPSLLGPPLLALWQIAQRSKSAAPVVAFPVACAVETNPHRRRLVTIARELSAVGAEGAPGARGSNAREARTNFRRSLPILASSARSFLRRNWPAFLLVIVVGKEDFALALVVGFRNHPFLFHPFDQPRGAVIADDEPPLDVARGGAPLTGDDGKRLVVQFVAALAAAGVAENPVGIVAVVVLFLGDRVEIVGCALCLEEPHHVLDFAVGDEGAVDAADASARH